MKLYHGSQEENFVPTFGLGNDGHDYGRGFYLTEFPELAKEWAVAAEWYGRYNRRDRDARSKMYDIIENDPRNDLSRTFKDVL